jgi:hypothetical protein
MARVGPSNTHTKFRKNLSKSTFLCSKMPPICTDRVGLEVGTVQQGGIVGEKISLGRNLDHPIGADKVKLGIGRKQHGLVFGEEVFP